MANDVFKVLKTQERVSAQLDKLCEWLAEEMKLPAPCYYREGICPYEDFGICRLDEAPDLKNCWKQFMTKWLEGLAYDPR